PKAVDGSAPYAVYNLGNRRSEELMDVVSIIEREVGRKAEINYKPIQPGDVIETYADITDSTADFGFEPKTNIAEGLPAFIRWYRGFYNV
ncbi:MAG: protein CapI, partial [Rhodospirillales bacterium]|nr:protein CapI [Rhodospirillales bacterium]